MLMKFSDKLWKNSRKENQKIESNPLISKKEILTKTGNIIRNRREYLGISMIEMADDTLITVSVLEALERGWQDRLPERTYLISMLARIEKRLDLPENCLKEILPIPTYHEIREKPRFTPGNIDILTTWQGNIVYIFVICLSIFALNRQQLNLISQKSKDLQPVELYIEKQESIDGSNITKDSIKNTRSFDQSKQLQTQEWIALFKRTAKQPLNSLQLSLYQPSKVILIRQGKDNLTFNSTVGKLSLQLNTPIQLQIDPIPKDPYQVLWNNSPQTPTDNKNGIYRWGDPLNKLAAPAVDLPQNTALSP